jgi:hypothetical protein
MLNRLEREELRRRMLATAGAHAGADASSVTMALHSTVWRPDVAGARIARVSRPESRAQGES